jgi:hypothetical protein
MTIGASAAMCKSCPVAITQFCYNTAIGRYRQIVLGVRTGDGNLIEYYFPRRKCFPGLTNQKDSHAEVQSKR